MEIKQVDQLRPLLFEALDRRAGQLYYATRSKRYAEEVREYLLVIMSLTREYIRIHMNDFRLRNQRGIYFTKATSTSPIQYMEGWCEPKNFKNLLHPDEIRMKDIHAIRRWVWFVFDKILELHCFFEGLDYRAEHNKRYEYIRGVAVSKPGTNQLLIPKQRGHFVGGKALSTGEYGFGSLLREWSGEFVARRFYDCMNCPHEILPGQKYQKDVFRMGEGVEIMRYHVNCPPDPDDPLYEKNRELIDQPYPSEVKQGRKSA